MTKTDLKEGWNAFVRWRGWRAIAHWRGWKWIFPMPLWLSVLAFAVSGAGLIWVFVRGMENTPAAYGLYGASAYSLCALCVRLPGVTGRSRSWLDGHPKTARLLLDRELKFRVGLYTEQMINFGYGIFKIAAGVIVGSAWIGSDGIYNMVQAVIQLFQILRRKNPGSRIDQWKSYRLCGWLMLLMHLTLTGIVFQMVNWGRVDHAGEIMIIATAAFAFYKLIRSFIKLAKDRRHDHPVDSSVRMMELSQAVFAMFSLQAGLLDTFGGGEGWEPLLNLATGSVVCMTVCATGIYMIRRANREIRTLQETEHGA